MRGVPDPDPVLLPRNLRHCRQNRPGTERLARQRDAVLERDAQQRRGRHEHHAGVGAAVRELAMRAIHPPPGLDQIKDRLLLPRQQPVHRIADRPRSSSVPVSRSRARQRCARTSCEVEHPARAGVRPPVPDGASISPNSSSLVSALTRVGTGPKSPSAAFPGATSARPPSPSAPPTAVVLRQRSLQFHLLGRRHPPRLRRRERRQRRVLRQRPQPRSRSRRRPTSAQRRPARAPAK